ncbi:hypothetical protein GOODEAATRI_023472, partial [Goodea atripinnis]
TLPVGILRFLVLSLSELQGLFLVYNFESPCLLSFWPWLGKRFLWRTFLLL